MILYHYGPDGIYTRTSQSRLDAKATQYYGEPRYLIPANCTTVAPPDYDPETHLARWSNGQWQVELLPVPDPADPEAPPVDPLTLPISPRQIRLALAMNNLLAATEAALDDLSEPQKSLAKIEWEYATEFRRDNVLLGQIGSATGLTKEQIDAMWAEAVTL